MSPMRLQLEILEFLNWVGDLMVQEVVEELDEATRANRIMVNGEVAVFDQVRNLRFINRFGEHVVRPRRCYKFLNQRGSFAPVDAKLGIKGCFRFSPLMTMLICLLGADESYERSATKLQALLGYAVSSTAVQRTTENTGERIPDDPAECHRTSIPISSPNLSAAPPSSHPVRHTGTPAHIRRASSYTTHNPLNHPPNNSSHRSIPLNGEPPFCHFALSNSPTIVPSFEASPVNFESSSPLSAPS